MRNQSDRPKTEFAYRQKRSPDSCWFPLHWQALAPPFTRIRWDFNPVIKLHLHIPIAPFTNSIKSSFYLSIEHLSAYIVVVVVIVKAARRSPILLYIQRNESNLIAKLNRKERLNKAITKWKRVWITRRIQCNRSNAMMAKGGRRRRWVIYINSNRNIHESQGHNIITVNFTDTVLCRFDKAGIRRKRIGGCNSYVGNDRKTISTVC